MKLRTIARSAYITTSVLFVGAFVALSNPGILHADGPTDYLADGKLAYTSRVDLTDVKDDAQIEAEFVPVVESYNVSGATDERLQELLGEWGAHLLRLEGGEDLYDSDGRPVINDDGSEGLTLGSIQELRDEAKSQKDQAEEYIAEAETLRADAEEARTNAGLANTRENAAYYTERAEILDDQANILDSTAEILCGAADRTNEEADALQADAEQTKKNIADALGELEGRGVDVSGTDDDASDGGSTSTDEDGSDGLSVDEEKDEFLGSDDDSDDSDGSEFDPPDDDDVDSDASLTDDSSADVVTDGSSTDGDTADDNDSDDDVTFPIDPHAPGFTYPSDSDDSEGDSDDADDLSVEEEQDEYFDSLGKGTSNSPDSGDGTDWWKQDPIAGEWYWQRIDGTLELVWEGDDDELFARAREISEAGGYGSRDPFKQAWVSLPSKEDILKAEQIRLSGGYENWADNLDQEPGYLDWAAQSGSASDSSDSDDAAPVKVTLPESGDDMVDSDQSSNAEGDIPIPASTPTADQSVSMNTGNDVAVDTSKDDDKKIVKNSNGVERAPGEGNFLPTPKQAPTGPNTVLDNKLKALAANVTGPQDDDGNLLVPWLWEDIVVSPQVVDGLLLIRDMHVVHLESLAVKLDNTVDLPRADKIRIARKLREIAVEEVRPAYVNFITAGSTANDWHDKHETAYGLVMDEANRFSAAAKRLRDNGRNDTAEAMEAKAAELREWADTSAWGTYLSRRNDYYQLLAANPVLGIETDGDYFFNALRNMHASESDQDYVEIFNKYLKAGAAQAREQAAEAAAMTELDDLMDFGSPLYDRAQDDAVALTAGLGATIGSDLIDAVRLHFKATQTRRDFETGVVDASLGIIAAIAFTIPGVGPFISAGIALSMAAVEGGRYGMTYLDELAANETAAVTGYDKVIEAEDTTRAAGDRFQMAVVFAAFEIGSLQAARILGQAKGTVKAAGAGDDIVRAADDVADGARGLPRADADHWILTVPEGLRGEFIAKQLTELDNVVLGAQKAGLTEADIAPVLARLRQKTSLSFEAIEAAERELMVTIARQRGLTVVVHPETMQSFLSFAGEANLSHLRPMNLVELADVRIKALLERSGKPQFWTQAEIDLVNQVIRPAGDDAARWMSFEALQGLDPGDVGLRQIFTADDLKAINEVFDGGNLKVAPSTSPAPAAGSGTQRFPMEMPAPGSALDDTDIFRIDVPNAETVIIAPRFEIRPLIGDTTRIETVVIPRPGR